MTEVKYSEITILNQMVIKQRRVLSFVLNLNCLWKGCRMIGMELRFL